MPDDTAVRHSNAETEARRIVEAFLDASMIPDPVRARTYMAPDVKITFTGGRGSTIRREPPRSMPRATAASKRNSSAPTSSRAAPTTKRSFTTPERCTVNGRTANVLGQPLCRRFVVRHGKIVRMDVWNDSAEILLVRAGLAKM